MGDEGNCGRGRNMLLKGGIDVLEEVLLDSITGSWYTGEVVGGDLALAGRRDRS